jgi:hypothetical protein
MRSFIDLLANTATQLLGITNVTGAIIVATFAAALALYSWHKRRAKEGKRGVEPAYVIAFGFVIVAAGFIWQAFDPPATRSQIELLQANFDRFVKPRQLTPEQATIIIDYLLKRPPAETIEIISAYPDDEARHYAAQFRTIFTKADWKTTSRSQTGKLPNGEPIDDGLMFFVEYPPKPQNSRILSVVEEAFHAAGIQSGGMTSWHNKEITETKVLICVGHRPRI